MLYAFSLYDEVATGKMQGSIDCKNALDAAKSVVSLTTRSASTQPVLPGHRAENHLEIVNLPHT